MKELLSFGILDGPAGHMTFCYSIDNFINNRYYIAGQVVQWSIRNGGPGLPVFSPVVYDLMAGLTPSNILDEVEHVDETLKTNIRRVCTL